MNDTQQHPKPPSERQLSLLRRLAAERGESFAWPTTSGEASSAIERLLARKRSTGSEARRERSEVSRAMARGDGALAAIGEQEIGGYGSSAHWR